MIRAVVFDFNGVLVDDESLHFALFQEVLAEEGVELTEAMYHDKYLGYDDIRCFEAVLIDSGRAVDADSIAALVDRKALRYLPRAESGLRVFPSAADCVRAMAERWPVAINSGALRPEIEFALRKMNVRQQVAAIVSAEDTAMCKPDPEGYLLALDSLRAQSNEGLEAGHCLVFEDSLAGIRSAKGAGMWVVGVSNTYSETELREAGADAVTRGLEGINPAWVDRLFAPEITP